MARLRRASTVHRRWSKLITLIFVEGVVTDERWSVWRAAEGLLDCLGRGEYVWGMRDVKLTKEEARHYAARWNHQSGTTRFSARKLP